MLSVLLGWLPIIGPIINGAVSVFTKMQDTKVVQIQTDAATKQVETQTSAQIIEATKDDIGLRIARDIIVWPVCIWTALLSWDTIIAESSFKDYMFHVASFQQTSAPYLPYAVIIFLLGNIGINTFSKR
jgi:hypothetical protein